MAARGTPGAAAESGECLRVRRQSEAGAVYSCTAGGGRRARRVCCARWHRLLQFSDIRRRRLRR